MFLFFFILHAIYEDIYRIFKLDDNDSNFV